MTNFLSIYREFIHSREQLDQVRRCTSVKEFLTALKKIWQITELADEQVLHIIHECNRHVVDINLPLFSSIWLAYGYHSRSRHVRWCLPCGHATEPFQDQYIERCRQQSLINQLLQPKASINSLFVAQFDQFIAQPAGFIFHLSRCGSTLISGCLSELATTNVVSESPVLTEILLDASLNDEERTALIKKILSAQTCLFPEREQLVIKWNAWDILCWPLIRKLYPQVPAIFIVREPVEILASHQRMAGRHMAGDPTMAFFNPLFELDINNKNILDRRINVLSGLLEAMIGANGESNILVVDYQQITAKKIIEIAHFFNIQVPVQQQEKIHTRMQVHSKLPTLPFSSDVTQKRQLFSTHESDAIHYKLHHLYQDLLSLVDISHD